MDNTSTMKRPSRVNVNNDKANGTTKETKVTNKNLGDNTFEIVQNNGEMPQAMNRAQRRAMAKREKKAQSQQKKRIMDYIKKHPEAVKIELDEEKIAEVEEQEDSSVMKQEDSPVGKRVEMNPIDEACDIEHVCDIDPVDVSETENAQEVIEKVTNEVNKFGFTPVPKTNVIDVDFKEAKE